MPLLDLLRPVSDEELRALSERNPGWQFERLEGGRLVVSPTGGEGGRMGAALLGQLYRWNEAGGLGVVFDASTGFKLPDGSVLAPDAAFLRSERWQALSPEEQEGFPPLAPDAVFEVRSRSQILEELRAKAAWYLKNGVCLVVLLDPYAHRVEVFRPGGMEGHQGPEGVPLYHPMRACARMGAPVESPRGVFWKLEAQEPESKGY